MIRGRQLEYQCRNCQRSFTARVADRARGWAQYCSKACKQVNQEQGKRMWKILTKKA